MLHAPNKIKQAIACKAHAYGFILTIPAPQVVDILGRLRLDFVQIDGEHGLFDMPAIEGVCRAADLAGMTPIARVPDISSPTINRFLDRGIQGIIGPHISTPEDAEQLVRASYFGPAGDRSFGDGRGVHYAAGKSDQVAYYEEANRHMLVGAMLEDRAAVENLTSILEVPGIDFFYIGMNDFAQGLGYPGQPSHPEVRTMRAHVVEQIRNAGKLIREDIFVEIRTNDLLINGMAKVIDARNEEQSVSAADSGA